MRHFGTLLTNPVRTQVRRVRVLKQEKQPFAYFAYRPEPVIHGWIGNFPIADVALRSAPGGISALASSSSN